MAAPDSPGGVIGGTVLHLITGEPIRRARVVLSSGPVQLIAESDAKGKFEFTALPAGTYRMSAKHPGFMDLREGRAIVLGRDESFTGAELRMRPYGAIGGRVLDAAGEPVQQAVVNVCKLTFRYGTRTCERVKSVEAGENGEYRITRLHPGRYLVEAHDPRPPVKAQYGRDTQRSYVATYYPNAITEADASPVEISAGGSMDTVDVRLVGLLRATPVKVSGSVMGIPPGSAPVIGVSAVSADRTLSGGAGTTAHPPNYHFELNVRPGEYTLAGNTYSGEPVLYGSAKLAANEQVDGFVLPLLPAPELTGRIVVPQSAGTVNLERVRVVLVALSEFREQPWHLRCDQAGKFAVPRPLRPGRYAIESVDFLPAGYFVDRVVWAGHEADADALEVTSSGQLQIHLRANAGKLSGTVVDGEGKPVPFAAVTLTAAQGRSWPDTREADEAGKFEYSGIRPGAYRLLAWEQPDWDTLRDPEYLKRFASYATTVTVDADSVQSLKLFAIADSALR